MTPAASVQGESAPAKGSAGRARALRVAAVLAGVAGLVSAWAFLPVDEWLLGVVEWVRGAGAAGVLFYSLAYILATVLLLPGSVLTLGAGFAYGPLYGTLLVSPVSVVAATASFLLGRFVARRWVAGRVQGDPRFVAIDEAIGKSGFKIVLLLRLSPVFPFNLTNYALGLTGVKFRDYVLASWVGMLPGTFLFVYLGSLVTSAAELLSRDRPGAGPWGHVLLVAGLVATIAVTVVITRVARKALREALERAGGAKP
ncbi:MAG: TVP38/TMEM64 family protein [Planctomycetes bacterium]|nr:TVP38/TMEM64 family protein [Planctomycetota bacterium]